MPGKITYSSAYGRTQPPTEARRRWGNIKDTVRYSPYNAHTRLNIPIPPGLKKDDWLKHHGYQNTIEFEDHAPQDEYETLKMEWAAYGQAGGYGPGIVEGMNGGELATDIVFEMMSMRGGKRKSKGKKRRVKSKTKRRVKSKGKKSKSKTKTKTKRRVKSKGKKRKSKSKRRVKSKRN